MPVFRDIGDTGVAEAIGIGVGDVLAGDGQGARLDLPQAGEDLDQLGLAVAFDAADPEDLPATQLQALDIDDLAAAVVVRLDVPRREDRRARRGGRSGDGERDIASDHEVGELLGGRVLRLTDPDCLAPANDGNPVTDRGDLAQLVRDEDDGAAVVTQALEDAIEVLDLLRSQESSRLVEDQDAAALVERPKDLDALLDADGEILDAFMRVDLQAVGAGELGDAAFCLVAVEHRHIALVAKDDVFRHGESGDQHEVLVHHAEPGVDGFPGAAETGRLAVDANLALIRRMETEEDVHQGRLAGAIFAKQGMDFALAYLEGNAVVGNDARESFDDIEHLDGPGPGR